MPRKLICGRFKCCGSKEINRSGYFLTPSVGNNERGGVGHTPTVRVRGCPERDGPTGPPVFAGRQLNDHKILAKRMLHPMCGLRNRIPTPSLTVCAEWPPTPILLRKTLWHIRFLVGMLAATWPPTFPRPTKLTPFRTASKLADPPAFASCARRWGSAKIEVADPPGGKDPSDSVMNHPVIRHGSGSVSLGFHCTGARGTRQQAMYVKCKQ
jgi:hypothetical protein